LLFCNIILNRNVALQGNAELVGLHQAVKFAYLKRKSKMEFNKIDFAKLFDITVAIDNMHKGATTMITYMPEQVRTSVHTVVDAQFGLIRTTNKAVKEFAETVESVAKDAQKEITKTVEKATKVAV
jgi:predicted RNA-binding protein with EMAP domain